MARDANTLQIPRPRQPYQYQHSWNHLSLVWRSSALSTFGILHWTLAKYFIILFVLSYWSIALVCIDRQCKRWDASGRWQRICPQQMLVFVVLHFYHGESTYSWLRPVLLSTFRCCKPQQQRQQHSFRTRSSLQYKPLKLVFVTFRALLVLVLTTCIWHVSII